MFAWRAKSAPEKMIFIFGNGGSGATASHFAGDFNKGISYGLKKRFKVLCLNDNIPAMLALANDCTYDDIFVEQLKNFLSPGDVVIGISGSGNSKNVLKAISYANQKQATIIALTGFKGGQLKKITQFCLVVPIEDMEKTEDIHLILMHLIKQYLISKFHYE